MSSPDPPPAARIDALDGIRACAVSAVIIGHTTSWMPGGQVGVDMFFGLSGLLITGILLREHSVRGRISLGAFYARRALRLVPALMVFLIGAAVFSLIEGYPRVLLDFALAATYTMNFLYLFDPDGGTYVGHTWSLATEEQFYVLWPIALIGLLRLRPEQRIWVLGSAILGFIIVTWGVQRLDPPLNAIYALPTTRAPELLVGALAALAWHRGLSSSVTRIVTSVPVAIVAIAIVALWTQHDTWSDPWSYRGGFTVVAVLTVVVALHVSLRSDSPVARVLGAPPLVWIGRRSYAMYLWHLPLVSVVWKFAPNQPIALIVLYGLTAAIAELSWRFVEQPFLRRKRRFEYAHLVGDSAAAEARKASGAARSAA